MAFSYTFACDQKTRIGTMDSEPVFASRVKRGKEYTLTYYLGDDTKATNLKGIASCILFPPFTPKVLEGLSAASKRMTPQTNLVIDGVLAEDAMSETEGAVGAAAVENNPSASTSNAQKRKGVAKGEGGASNKKAKVDMSSVRAAGTLSEAMNLLQQNGGAAQEPGGDGPIQKMIQSNESLQAQREGESGGANGVKGGEDGGDGSGGDEDDEEEEGDDEGDEGKEDGAKERSASKDGAKENGTKKNGTKENGAKGVVAKGSGGQGKGKN